MFQLLFHFCNRYHLKLQLFKVLIMSIKNFLKVLVFLLISSTAMGMPKIYGKLNLSIDYDGGNGASTNSDLISNASRVGMKGDFEINDKLTGIYQLEYQVDVANNSSSTFKTRNSFLGITGNFGTIRVGTYDTPLKRAGLKADLFNDLRGDIKNITAGENRNSSFLGYESPELTKGLSLHLGVSKGAYYEISNCPLGVTTTINGLGVGFVSTCQRLSLETGLVTYSVDSSPSQTSFGKNISFSLVYDIEVIQFALASEQKSAFGFDHNRLGMMIPAGPTKIGLIYTTTKSSRQYSNGHDYDAYTFSISGKVAEGKGTVKFQYSNSDALVGLEQIQLGYDHKLSDSFKVFTYHTNRSVDASNADHAYTGIGLEFKF